MELQLPLDDLRGLESAFRTLLSPLDHADADEWRLESMRTVRDLVGADVACFCLALEARPLFVVEPDQRSVIEALEEHYSELDGGMDERRRELGLQVAQLSWLFDMRAYRRTEFWNDFVVPNRLFDTTVLLSEVGPGGTSAGMIFHHDEPTPPRPFGERELTLLRLLVPALEAGVTTCVEWHDRRDTVVRTVDAVSQCLLLSDVGGRVVHMNPAFTAVLDCDPMPEKLLWAARRAARSLGRLLGSGAVTNGTGPIPAPWQAVRTAGGDYRLRGSLIGAGVADGLALIVLERREPSAPDPETLRLRFRLSPREAEVALLLAARRTNDEIAHRLGISPHTARRHTERALHKLGVRSRHAVGSRILDA